MVFICIYNNH